MKDKFILSFTFDDTSTKDWNTIAKICKPLNIKNTFYINTCGMCWKSSSVNVMTTKEISIIKKLIQYKHEICYHTHKHI